MHGRFASLLVLACAVSSATHAGQTPAVGAFLRQHCYDCHSPDLAEGGLDLVSLGFQLGDEATLARWVRVYDRVAAGEMPPSDVPVPASAARTAFLGDLGQALTHASAANAETVLRRLNRFEDENTLRDMLGDETELRELLPEDGRAHGFDKVGAALDLSPVQLQRYMEAAGLALDAAVCRGPKPEGSVETLTFDTGRNEENLGKFWARRDDGAIVFYLDGRYPAIKVHEHRAAVDGKYRIRLHAAAHQSAVPLVYGLYVGPDSFQKSSTLHAHLQAEPGRLRVTEVEAFLRRGDGLRIMIHNLDNRWQDVHQKADAFDGPGLAIGKIEVEGPLVSEWPTPGHRLRFGDLVAVDTGPANQRDKPWYRPKYAVTSTDPAADIRRLLPPFVERAFRRPIAEADVRPYVALADAELEAGAPFEQALRTAQIAVLCSPDFLFLIEGPGRLDDLQLASRLSYFLWASLPDEELLAVARRGELTRPEVLRAQTERLLASPKADRFRHDFVDQWLKLREIDFTTPDEQLYPEFDDLLKDAMVQETRLFFAEVLRENRSLLEFVDSDWTFLNERLARHYGIEGVAGVAMRKATLRPEHRRGGVLTQASVLKVSANGTTTSPVTRGAYVLERVLGIEPPPPPPGVPGVEPDIRGASTLRELLAKHRAQESCVHCHKLIDPPGFALESYDAMGGWRENYRSLGQEFPKPSPELTGGQNVRWRVGPAVDPSGETADGQTFADIDEYKQILLEKRQRITRALAEKLATYASGRGMGFSDRPTIERIADDVAAKGYGFRDLLHAVLASELFLRK